MEHQMLKINNHSTSGLPILESLMTCSNSMFEFMLKLCSISCSNYVRFMFKTCSVVFKNSFFVHSLLFLCR